MDKFALLQTLVQTLGIPVALVLAQQLLAVAQAHGYRTTYAAAVVRAVGAGQSAAAEAGLSMFSVLGRQVAVQAGADYLVRTVPLAAAHLGINDLAEHAARVNSQIGLLAAEAAAAVFAQDPMALIAQAAATVTAPVPLRA